MNCAPILQIIANEESLASRTVAVDSAGGKLNAGGQGNGYYFIRGNSWGKAILKLVHVLHERTTQF
jgi:hypothetical protein